MRKRKRKHGHFEVGSWLRFTSTIVYRRSGSRVQLLTDAEAEVSVRDEAADDAEDSPHPHDVFSELFPQSPLSPFIPSGEPSLIVEGFPSSPLSPAISSDDSHTLGDGPEDAPLTSRLR